MQKGKIEIKCAEFEVFEINDSNTYKREEFFENLLNNSPQTHIKELKIIISEEISSPQNKKYLIEEDSSDENDNNNDNDNNENDMPLKNNLPLKLSNYREFQPKNLYFSQNLNNQNESYNKKMNNFPKEFTFYSLDKTKVHEFHERNIKEYNKITVNPFENNLNSRFSEENYHEEIKKQQQFKRNNVFKATTKKRESPLNLEYHSENNSETFKKEVQTEKIQRKFDQNLEFQSSRNSKKGNNFKFEKKKDGKNQENRLLKMDMPLMMSFGETSKSLNMESNKRKIFEPLQLKHENSKNILVFLFFQMFF